MNMIFSQTNYVLKRQGLSISGKYCLYGQNEEPLLYIEEKSKWIPPSTVIHMYADEKKTREVLTLKDSEAEDLEMDIIDAETGQKIGGIGSTADSAAETVMDVWAITDVNNQPIGKVSEISVGKSILREVTGNELPQNLDIKVGETVAAELRQKVKMIGYELALDFSMDIVHILDRRLGIAAAIHAAYHQGKEL